MVQAGEHLAGGFDAVPRPGAGHGAGGCRRAGHRDGDVAPQQLVVPAPRDDRAGAEQFVADAVAPAEHLRGG
jgi:hypothetical protein